MKDFLKKLKSPKYKVLTKEEEIQYFTELKNGKSHFKQIIMERNLALVIKIATKAKNRGVPLEDLINEGCIGLATAVDKFDLSRGFRFSTYAVSWIYKHVNICVSNGRSAIKIPSTTQANVTKVLNVFNNDPIVSATNYTIKELSEKTGMSERVVEGVLAGLHLYNVENLEDILNKSLVDANSVEKINLNYDENNLEYDFKTVDKRSYLVKKFIQLLPEKSRLIVVDFYGLNDEAPKDVKTIAKEKGTSYARVRHCVNDAIVSIREDIEKYRLERSDLGKKTVDIFIKKSGCNQCMFDYYYNTIWVGLHCDLLPKALSRIHFFTAANFGVDKAITMLQKITKSPLDKFLTEETIVKANDMCEESIKKSYAELYKLLL